MKRLLWFCPVVLAGIAYGCSGEQGRQRVAAPALAATPFTIQTAEEPPPAPATEARLDLERFRPLLAEPALAQAREALENDDPAAAASHVERVMAATPPPGSEVERWQMLLAVLRERAGNLLGAVASYELAARSDWSLAGYARLGAARVHLRAGYPDRALEHLTRVSSKELVGGDARLLAAEAHALIGDTEAAISVWREHLRTDAAVDRTAVALRLAEALLEQHAHKSSPASAPPVVGAAVAAKSIDAIPAEGEKGSVGSHAAIADEVLTLVRRVAIDAAANSDVVQRALALETRALAMLSPGERAARLNHSPAERLVLLEAQVNSGRHSDAEIQAEQLLASLSKSDRWGETGCEASVLRGKALAGLAKWGKAADLLGDAARLCQNEDLRARALFLAGKYSDSDKRYAGAIRYYEQLERDLPGHRLADDARLRAAMSHLSLGAEARFTELLGRMPDDYPAGDMVLDGVFQLATRRLEKGDWPGAVTVLERASALASPRDRARGHEFAGRERYFLARARAELGEGDRALEDFERIVREYPLSYYMLHAYARLFKADADRARRAREDAMQKAAVDPFSFAYRPEFDDPGFRRALELLRLGEVDLARRELSALGLPSTEAAPELLWGVALLYARAGAYVLSHGVARGLLTDWLERWPAGDWARAWELAFPRPYHDIVAREARKNGIPEYLVYAIMREESAFEPKAVSSANAYGLMQIIEPTARHYAKHIGLPSDPAALTRPPVNIALGCRVLADLTKRFSDNPLFAIPGYNAGPGRPQRWATELASNDFDLWVELIPFRETRRYTKRVLASRAAYAFLYEEAESESAMRLPLRVQ